MVSSFGATARVRWAPASRWRQVSLPLVSMVKAGFGMCLTVTTL
jgi:hypothetical protein